MVKPSQEQLLQLILLLFQIRNQCTNSLQSLEEGCMLNLNSNFSSSNHWNAGTSSSPSQFPSIEAACGFIEWQVTDTWSMPNGPDGVSLGQNHCLKRQYNLGYERETMISFDLSELPVYSRYSIRRWCHFHACIAFSPCDKIGMLSSCCGSSGTCDPTRHWNSSSWDVEIFSFGIWRRLVGILANHCLDESSTVLMFGICVYLHELDVQIGLIPDLKRQGNEEEKKCLADVFKKYEKSIETVSNCMEIGIIWSSMSLWFVAFTWCVIGDTGEYECFQFQCWRLSGVMTELAVGSETAGFRLVGKNLQIDSPHKAARIQRLRYSIKFIPELGALND